MKVLIIGGSSLLGKALLTTTDEEKYEVTSTWHTNNVHRMMSRLDVRSRIQVSLMIERIHPDVVIQCADITSVDFVEKNYVAASETIVDGCISVLEGAREWGARVVYISTNAVFGGIEAPYSEDSRTVPINRYGTLKNRAEGFVIQERDWIIVRPHLLYGWPWPGGRGNWATNAIKALRGGNDLRVVNDRITQPLCVLDCADAIWTIIEKGELEQVYHVAGPRSMSLHQYIQEVKHTWDPEGVQKVIPIESSELGDIAPRPQDTSYALNKIHSLGVQPADIVQGLAAMKNRWERGVDGNGII